MTSLRPVSEEAENNKSPNLCIVQEENIPLTHMSASKGRAAPEALTRMSFLYKAADLAARTQPEGVHRVLSSHLSHLLVGVSRKAVIRTTGSVKRSICKSCHAVLVPGVLADARLTKDKKVELTCRQCGAVKVVFAVDKKAK
jgi:ribonuclease P protein subunit RPR2